VLLARIDRSPSAADIRTSAGGGWIYGGSDVLRRHNLAICRVNQLITDLVESLDTSISISPDLPKIEVCFYEFDSKREAFT
jgi:hypothetical protein